MFKIKLQHLCPEQSIDSSESRKTMRLLNDPRLGLLGTRSIDLLILDEAFKNHKPNLCRQFHQLEGKAVLLERCVELANAHPVELWYAGKECWANLQDEVLGVFWSALSIDRREARSSMDKGWVGGLRLAFDDKGCTYSLLPFVEVTFVEEAACCESAFRPIHLDRCRGSTVVL